MQKLILVILLFFPYFLHAESSVYARIAGLQDIQNLMPTNQKYLASPKYLFNLVIPGEGRVRIKLTQNHSFKVVPIFTSHDNIEKLDRAKSRLFRGQLLMKSKVHHLAGSVIFLKQKPFLVLSFNTLNPRTGRKNFYKVKISLEKIRPISARIFRFNNFSLHNFDLDQLIAPQIALKEIQKSALQQHRLKTNAEKFKTLSINIDADAYWHEIYGADSNSVITSFLNEAENIYQNDLKIKFRIVRQNVFTDQTFGSNSAIDKLCNYLYFTTGESSLADSGCELVSSQGPQPYSSEANAHHLFTGQKMRSSTIGLAFVGTVCSLPSYAVAISQLTSAATTPITFAHELAHNLSAIHDGSTGHNGDQITSCPETEIPNIMNPFLSYDPPENFSNCSRNLIAKHLDEQGSCLNKSLNSQDLPPSQPEQMSLNLRFRENGNLIGRLTLPSAISLQNPADCLLEMVIAKDLEGLQSSMARKRLSIISDSLNLRFKNKFSVAKNKAGKTPPIYFKSQLTCGEKLLLESKTKKVATSIINQNKRVGIKRFIQKIADSPLQIL